MFSCNRATIIAMIRNYLIATLCDCLKNLVVISFNQQEAKPKPISPCTLSHAMNKLWVTARNSDHLNLLFAPVPILLVAVLTLVLPFIWKLLSQVTTNISTWSAWAWRPMMIGFDHPGTNRGIFLQIIASLNTVPPRMLRIVPLGDFHIFFKLNSGCIITVTNY